jgi:UDP-N-acetylglucosamine--N-acetylmuramyl-(pentapeptide) pyrophosphoryl-undecaprenol N-acetylglucosamine transferase
VVPALALADVLTARGHQVAFCGTERGMEKDLVPRAGYPFSLVLIRGFQRSLGMSTLRTVGSLPLAGIDAWKLLRSYRPDCVVGVGAYASGPVVAEAAAKGIPAVAIEMDAHMGVTNRILSRFVKKVCLSFPRPDLDARKYVYTGRPLRPALLAATREQGLARFHLDGERKVLLVNKRNREIELTLPGSASGMEYVDQTTMSKPPGKEAVNGDKLKLRGFGVAVVTMTGK